MGLPSRPFFLADCQGSDRQQRPVIVAVAIMHMMQPAIDQKIDMIAMRHRLVPATGTVDMATCRRRDAAIRIGGADGDDMFIDMIAMDMVQMAVV